MKKFLLSLVALLAATFSFAQKVSLDFTNPVGDWNLPLKANAITEATTVTNGTYSVILSASTAAYAGGSEANGYTYLMIGKSGSTVTLPAFDFAVGKIEVVGNAGASANTLMNVYVGETAVSTETKGSAETNTYAIDAAYQAAGNVYVLTVTSSHNAQITKINIYEAGDDNTGGGSGDVEPELPNLVSVAEAQAAEAGTEVTVSGTVYAVGATSFVVGDATGYIFHYGAAEVKVGDTVNVTGAVSAYGGFNQFKSATVTVVKSGSVKYPDPVVMDGAAMDAWIAAPAIQYVKYTGKLTISGNYYNVAVEGAETAVGSIIKANADLLEKMSNGNEYVFTGFAMYVSGTKYVNTIITDVKAVGEEVVLKDISNTLETAYTVSQAVALIDDANNDLSKKVYIKGIVSAPYKEVFVDHSYGNATFFISEDGSAESQQFEIFRGYSFGGVKFAENEDIKLGDEVVFYGALTKYNTTYETTQGAELVQLNGKAEFDAINSIQAEKNAAIYDLSGRKVSKAQKGLYIISGRKVVK